MLRYLYVILLARYIVYVQSMCVPICISIGTKFTNLENMQKSYVLFYVTLRKKNGTSFVMPARDHSHRYFH